MLSANRYEEPSALGLVEARLEAVRTRVQREVDEGLLPSAQIAVARHGKLAMLASYGTATDDSLVSIFSATKAITSAAAWLLIAEGKLGLSERVAAIVPEFAENQKESITVEQLFTHTAGFPAAPFAPLDWLDAPRRLERYAQWRLNWEPGSRYEYHPTSTMWMIAELVERRSGTAFDGFVHERLAQPLGLTDLYLGRPVAPAERVLPCLPVGDPLGPDDYAKLGIPVPPVTEVTEAAILNFNNPDIRAVGVPGGGGVTSAAEIAMFYQALLHGGLDGERVWSDATLNDAKKIRTGDLRDPLFRQLANRGLGLVIAGDDKRSYRGFGKTNSPLAFGHNGAGGQLAWADPATGISIGYVTSGHDRNEFRQARRGVAISSLAALCAEPLD